MIDKSIRADYAIQGGGPNYLGKQKMVKAPKKWLSSPDHEPAELAYITEKEKDILIDLDIYGSLNGKPNRGPSGIISLQGDLGGYGGSGGSSSSGGGGNGGGNRGNPHRDQPAPARVSPMQSMAMTGNTSLAGKTQSQAQASVDRGEAKAAAKSIGDLDEAESIRADLQKPIDDAARVREILTRGRGTEVPGERLFEDRISKYAVDEIDPFTGEYNAEAIQKAAKKESRARALGIGDPLTGEQITSLPTSTRIADFVPTQTRIKNLQEAGSKFLPSFMKEGIGQKAKSWLGKKALGFGMEKAGITGFLPQAIVPWGLSKIFGGKKNPLRTVKSQIAKFKKPTYNTQKEATKKLVKHEPVDRDGNNIIQQVAGDKDVISEGIKKYTLTDDQRKEATERRGIVQNILNQGSYQGNELTNQQRDQLTNYIAQIEQYLVPVEMAAHGGRIDKPFTGRSRDI